MSKGHSAPRTSREWAYYPTPLPLADLLARETLQGWAHGTTGGVALRLADFCAGDGRLGRAVLRAAEASGHAAVLTHVELEQDRCSALEVNASGSELVVKADATSWQPVVPFDIIVVNPPFLPLDRGNAQKLGIKWEDAMAAGKDLSGVVISNVLHCVRDGGIVGAIAPLTWIRSLHGARFRHFLTEQCDEIRVVVLDRSGVFDGVSHGIALHVLRKRTAAVDVQLHGSARKSDSRTATGQIPGTRRQPTATPSVRWSSLDEVTSRLQQRVPLTAVLPDSPLIGELAEVFVGSVVWNRSRYCLAPSGEGTMPVVYGANILSSGALSFDIPRRKQVQFIKLKESREQQRLICSPAILIRRTLRGHAGNWKADACTIPAGMTAVAENHVIVVQLPPGTPEAEALSVSAALQRAIETYYHASSSPNISTTVVRRLACGPCAKPRANASVIGQVGRSAAESTDFGNGNTTTHGERRV